MGHLSHRLGVLPTDDHDPVQIAHQDVAREDHLAAAGDGSGGMCENHAPAGVSVTAGETAAPLGERNRATTLAEAEPSANGTMVLSVRWG